MKLLREITAMPSSSSWEDFHHALPPPTEWSEEEVLFTMGDIIVVREAQLGEDKHQFIVVDKKIDRVVGELTVIFNYDRHLKLDGVIPFFEDQEVITVPMIDIASSHRNRGIGKAIYRHFLDNGYILISDDIHTEGSSLLYASLSREYIIRILDPVAQRLSGPSRSFVQAYSRPDWRLVVSKF